MTEPLAVCERFYSIQGESTRAGLPCLFIRLSGCNLRCRYCDASYSWQEQGELLTVDQLADWVETVPGILVEITGGEPLCQEAVYPLLKRLTVDGRDLLLETNGSLDLARVPLTTGIIMDVKCPGSNMAEHLATANFDQLRRRAGQGSRDEVKFVLSDEADFHWACDVVRREDLTSTLPVLFSPVTNGLAPARLAELLLAEQVNVRLQLQLHTLLWPEKNRGF